MSFVELLEGAGAYTSLAEVSAEVLVDAPAEFESSDTFSIVASILASGLLISATFAGSC